MARLPHLVRGVGVDQFCPSPVASPILSTSPMVRGGLTPGGAQFCMIPSPGTPVAAPILGTSPLPRDRCYIQGAGPILGTSPKPCSSGLTFVPMAASSPLAQSPQQMVAFFPVPDASGTRTPESEEYDDEERSEADASDPCPGRQCIQREEEEPAEAEEPSWQKSSCILKNSFLDTPLQRSPSLEKFYRERKVHSSPPSIAVDLCTEENMLAIATPSGSSVGEYDLDDLTASAQILAKGKYSADLSDMGGSTRAGSGSVPDMMRQSTSYTGSGCFSDISRPGKHGEDAVIGSAELPSRGSALHKWGACKPCAFASQGLCRNDVNCEFCHLCEPGEKKRRRREWLESRREHRRPDDSTPTAPMQYLPAGSSPIGAR